MDSGVALCAGAVVAGVLASAALPFLPFAVALTIAVAIGAAWSVAEGSGLGPTGLRAGAVLVVTQVGFGLGVVATAFLPLAGQAIRTLARSRGDADADGANDQGLLSPPSEGDRIGSVFEQSRE